MNSRVYNLAKRFRSKYFGTIAFRLKAHSKVIEEHIDKGEKLLYVFCGQKGYSHKEIFSTCIIALTEERIMIATKRVLWGYFYTTITPDLLNDLKVQSGLFFGRVIIDTAKEVIAISNLSKKSLAEVETAISTYMVNDKNEIKNELKKKK